MIMRSLIYCPVKFNCLGHSAKVYVPSHPGDQTTDDYEIVDIPVKFSCLVHSAKVNVPSPPGDQITDNHEIADI